VNTLNLFTADSPAVREPSTGAEYVAGEFEAVNWKWDK
jgi:hypothetical protein